MTRGTLEPKRWPRRRWWFWVVAICLLQLGFIFALSSRSPLLVRPSVAVPRLELAADASPELLALHDPSLLALPHRQGFSGPAWLEVTNEFHSVDWTEPTNWLALSNAELGATFQQAFASNRLERLYIPSIPKPELILPEVKPTITFPQTSRLRIEGALAQRPLSNAIALRSWPPRTNSANEPDLLTNTVVQMVVDAAGKPVSLTLLSRSGLPAADEEALAQAAAARFQPVAVEASPASSNTMANLSWGQLVFEWHTGTAPGPQRPP